MTQSALFASAPRPKARRGDIFALGRHRLMCGDATDKESVAALFDGRKPTLVVTSPPYADARNYNDPIPCWDSMMLGAFDGHDLADDVQLLINLGVIHRKGEWVPYWWNWLQKMREIKWQHAGLYPWDKLEPIPGAPTGAPRPSHEFIFHLRKKRKLMNLTVPNKRAGATIDGCKYRDANGKNHSRKKTIHRVASHRVLDSVIRLSPEKANKTGHPAVYPVSLPQTLVAAYVAEGTIVYDPFGGTATTFLACESEGVDGVAMEISPAYCDLAIARWRKVHPDQAITLISYAAEKADVVV